MSLEGTCQCPTMEFHATTFGGLNIYKCDTNWGGFKLLSLGRIRPKFG